MIIHVNRPRAESSAANPPHMHSTSDTADEQAEVIEANSPEGRPGDPKLRAPGMLAWTMVIIGGVVIGAIVIGATQGLIAGVFALVLGLCLGIIANTEVWAAASRAKERHDLDVHSDEREGHK